MFTLKKVILSASLALTVSSVAFAQAPQTQIQKESYSMGATLGNVIAGQVYRQTELGAEVDMAAVVQGFNDALKGKTELSDDDMLKILNVRAEQLNKLEEPRPIPRSPRLTSLKTPRRRALSRPSPACSTKS